MEANSNNEDITSDQSHQVHVSSGQCRQTIQQSYHSSTTQKTVSSEHHEKKTSVKKQTKNSTTRNHLSSEDFVSSGNLDDVFFKLHCVINIH